MKFELKEWVGGVSDEKLLDDLRRCAKVNGRDTITRTEYEEIGKAHPITFYRRFGSWCTALRLAGLQPTGWKRGITDEELFENIKLLWISLGRQPSLSEVKKPISQFAVKPYQSRVCTWTKALRAIVEWVNSDSPEESPQLAGSKTADSIVRRVSTKRRTRREISERQRFRILVRDGFHCSACGASPLTQRDIELHVDHIVPWSQGGETTDDNLETKCKRCNLGKGNAFSV